MADSVDTDFARPNVNALEDALPTVTLTLTTSVLGADAMELAGTTTDRTVALVTVAASDAPLNVTVAPLTNPVPVTSSVNAPPPATVPHGLSAVIVGGGTVTESVTPELVPPPGAGLTTVIVRLPGEVKSPAGSVAVSSPLERVVATGEPFTWTSDAFTNPPPVTVRGCAPLPSSTEDGVIDEMVGAGLFTSNVRLPLTPPPGAGFVIVTDTIPAVETSLVVSWIVAWVADETVVARFVPLKVTVAPVTKLEPSSVKVCALDPTRTDEGLSVVRTGTGFGAMTVKVAEPLEPPPGPGLVTLTE